MHIEDIRVSWFYCWFLPPANEVCECYVFIPVCHSVHRGWGDCPVYAGIHTPREQTPPRSKQSWEHTPPGADTPQSRHPPRADIPPEKTPPGSRHPPGEDTPLLGADIPLHSGCWEIRATSGRYASYWNAYLFIGYYFSQNYYAKYLSLLLLMNTDVQGNGTQFFEH